MAGATVPDGSRSRPQIVFDTSLRMSMLANAQQTQGEITLLISL
jgi:hypothetical protein